MNPNQDQVQTQVQTQAQSQAPTPAVDVSRYITVMDPPVRSEVVGENTSINDGVLHYRLVFPVDVRIDFLRLAQDSGYGDSPEVIYAAAKAALDRAKEKALRAPHQHTRWLAQETRRRVTSLRDGISNMVSGVTGWTSGQALIRGELDAIDKMLTRIASFTTPEPEPENQFEAFPIV